jgi:CHAT domain-containing protein
MGLLNPLDVAADTGQELYKALLAPVMNDAPNDEHFIIVPDGDLHALNLETLPGQVRTKFWIEHAIVAIAPSLNYLAGNRLPSDRRSKVRPKKGLLIGDPVETAEYPRLKYAGQEMDSIASAMGMPEQRRGAEASPEAYTGNHPDRFDFIHFAAHAIANQNHPLDSAVILTGAPETFRLFARDVSNHRLKAEIVTISACRSAGAKTYAGEGLVGFAWAFLKAGAENVVAGLWDVNDESTAKLMTGLYTNIAARYPAPEALQRAKLTLIHAGGTWAKPRYWAPFELYMGAYRER